MSPHPEVSQNTSLYSMLGGRKTVVEYWGRRKGENMLVGKVGKRFVRIDCIAGVERDFGGEAMDDSWLRWVIIVLEV
ncbi:MAG: hypothetical protein Q9198_003995, partial [Flavoplaca austrocitrina]